MLVCALLRTVIEYLSMLLIYFVVCMNCAGRGGATATCY